MSPNTMTWIFLGVGIVWGGWYVWRQRRRPQREEPRPNPLYSEPMPKTVQEPHAFALQANVPSMYDYPPEEETAPIPAAATMASTGYQSVQPEAWNSTDAGRENYHRTETFESLSAGKKPNRLPQIEQADLPLTDPSDYVFGPLTPTLSALFPETEARQQEIKKELRHAGYYQPHALQNLNAIRYVSIMLPLIGLGILFVMSPRQLELPFLLAMVALMIVGWAVPRLWVRGQAKDRRSQIEKGLPDVLDLLNMCVSQGMTPLTAMTRVTHELYNVYPELTEELRIVAEQAKIGTMQQALENMRTRLDIPEVHSFANLLLQTERLGTSVSVALSEYAERMRETLRQRADQKANQASFKLLFPTVLCLMPAVYMFLLGPSIIELTDFFSGRNQAVNSADEAFESYTSRYSGADENN